MDLIESFPVSAGQVSYDGYVKFKLVHGPGRSVFTPDAVFIQCPDWVWFQAAFFSPPMLSFFDGQSYAQFNIDTDTGARLFIGTTGSRHIREFPDGSHLYHCKIAGPASLEDFAAGRARMKADSSFELQLFHHTAAATLPLIVSSGELRGSAWNYQGSAKLKNVAYVYFTHLPKIRSDLDLQLIAMSSSGALHFLLDHHTPPSGVVPVRVYRESTRNRTATLPLWVPAHVLSPSHLWMHEDNIGGIYFEVANSAIYRVGIMPATTLPFVGGEAVPDKAKLKGFDYMVIGDGGDPIGITAPLNEEDTRQIFKVERGSGLDPLSFWHRQANRDHFSTRTVGQQEFDRL